MAALVWANMGASTTREIVLEKLQNSASNPGGDNPYYGYGWVDMNNALE